MKRRRLLFLPLLAFAFLGLVGCGAQQQGDITQKESDLAANASQTISFAQTQVNLAQKIVAAYQAQIATLPAGDKTRASIEKSLANAQGYLVQAQLVLALLHVGTDVLARPPTTLPLPTSGPPSTVVSPATNAGGTPTPQTTP